jgi:hypothetical protein
MKLEALTPEQREAIRMRYIARAQLDSLRLHPDLCLRVLNDYGCNAVVVVHSVDTEDGDGAFEATRPQTGVRIRYFMSVLHCLVEDILTETAQADAGIAADGLTRLSELITTCELALTYIEDGVPRTAANRLYHTLNTVRGETT